MAGDADVGPDDAVTILVALLEEKDARLRDTLAREAELQGVNDELASRLAASQAANERIRTRMEGSLEAYRGTLEAAKASLRNKVRFSPHISGRSNVGMSSIWALSIVSFGPLLRPETSMRIPMFSHTNVHFSCVSG